MRRLVLASTSPFRKQLLKRLGLPFVTAVPTTDETPRNGETPRQLAARLAEAKAKAVAPEFPDSLVIGSDQVAVLDGTILGKPGTHDRAVAQLRMASGETVCFYTGLALCDTADNRSQVDVVPFRVVLRSLDEGRIERYLARERPYGCAGSFKSEGLGVALLERLEGDDPSALVGLPLIRLVGMLEAFGAEVI